MSSDPVVVVADAGVEHRLHPLSWLFTLIGQLKQFAIPLLIILFGGKGDDRDLYGLIGVGVLMAVSVAQYFTYRYRIDGDGIVIRSGLFQRSVRHIPFARIQNVNLHQSLLHRFFNVAEVRLESAGAAKPEGQMRVLKLEDAQRLERQIRALGTTQDQSTPEAAQEILLALPVAEVVRLGLINNRGIVVIGGLFAVLAQSGDNLIGKLFEALGKWFTGQADALHLSLLAAAMAAVFLVIAALVLLRLLSVQASHPGLQPVRGPSASAVQAAQPARGYRRDGSAECARLDSRPDTDRYPCSDGHAD